MLLQFVRIPLWGRTQSGLLTINDFLKTSIYAILFSMQLLPRLISYLLSLPNFLANFIFAYYEFSFE